MRVYPRVCGGNRRVCQAAREQVGLSPRVRGKPTTPILPSCPPRSIPACAGETGAGGWSSRPAAVYPRVCGGNSLTVLDCPTMTGLSPRVRGKPPPPAPEPKVVGSIPACAGETHITSLRSYSAKVYPRVCGGNVVCWWPPPTHWGLSPRVRGKHKCWYPYRQAARSIPACAGETPLKSLPALMLAVYPRVCGGNIGRRRRQGKRRGLSPRVRGKRRLDITATPPRRSIPACAGETPCASRWTAASAVYPRVCGGNYQQCYRCVECRGLSPRVRGKPSDVDENDEFPGSIPACAGETRLSRSPFSRRAVYPRVCGGNPPVGSESTTLAGLSPRVRGKPPAPSPAAASQPVYPRVCGGNLPGNPARPAVRGLSPRVRGKRYPVRRRHDNWRSIPACAGETGRRWRKGGWAGVYPRVCGGNGGPAQLG